MASVFLTSWGLAGVSATVLIISLLLKFLSPASFDYKDKHVLVTGGSSGIGLALAREYMKKGARVTIAARDITRLQEAKKSLDELVATGANAEAAGERVQVPSPLRPPLPLPLPFSPSLSFNPLRI